MTALTASGTALCSHFTGHYHVSTSKLASQSGEANRNNQWRPAVLNLGVR